MPQDTQLKTLLEKARNVCMHKHNQVAASINGTPSQKFIEVSAEQDSLFVKLSQPALMEEGIVVIDKTELSEKITAVDVLNPSQFNEYLTAIASFFAYLKENVLVHLPVPVAASQTTDWNLKVLDALRGMRRKITGRKRFFKNQGTDITNDLVYQKHKSTRNNYRDKLKNNEIQSVATDEITLLKFKDDIAEMTILASFMDTLGKTNTFMNEKLQEPADTPSIT